MELKHARDFESYDTSRPAPHEAHLNLTATETAIIGGAANEEFDRMASARDSRLDPHNVDPAMQRLIAYTEFADRTGGSSGNVVDKRELERLAKLVRGFADGTMEAVSDLRSARTGVPPFINNAPVRRWKLGKSAVALADTLDFHVGTYNGENPLTQID